MQVVSPSYKLAHNPMQPISYRQVIEATFANLAIPNWGTYESLFSSLSDKSPINPHQSPYLVVI